MAWAKKNIEEGHCRVNVFLSSCEASSFSSYPWRYIACRENLAFERFELHHPFFDLFPDGSIWIYHERVYFYLENIRGFWGNAVHRKIRQGLQVDWRATISWGKPEISISERWNGSRTSTQGPFHHTVRIPLLILVLCSCLFCLISKLTIVASFASLSTGRCCRGKSLLNLKTTFCLTSLVNCITITEFVPVSLTATS